MTREVLDETTLRPPPRKRDVPKPPAAAEGA
jgi:hypothetical protein